jgi:hypothetical protein
MRISPILKERMESVFSHIATSVGQDKSDALSESDVSAKMRLGRGGGIRLEG